MKYVLYNELSNNGNGKASATALCEELKENYTLIDVRGLDYVTFLKGLNADDEVYLVGGDGTLNYFINAIGDYQPTNNIYLRRAGSGNDFFTDVGAENTVCINEYIKDLPTVYVNGIEKKFINGIGYGIDGYCCEVADKIRETSPNKKIDYTGIAIKGLLFHFKRVTATVTVDGVITVHKNVWLTPTMKGRYYGGGMMVAPKQDRKDGQLSVVVFRGKSKLHTLMVFPSIFKGEHVKHEKMVKIFKGKEIEVSFDKPTALQIDGETVLGVTSYKVKA